MAAAGIVAIVLAGLVALGVWERRSRDRAHHRIPVRVHVNGTRGKSTVTRLIAAALREDGRRTVAKTTGTAARLILPDGSERAVRRRAPASVREQLWFLREARRLGADAVVVECMAVDPALQEISEREMLKATIGVITNVRADHADVMGTAPDDVARALAHTVPAGGVLVLGERRVVEPFEERARALGTRVVRAREPDPAIEAATWLPWQRDNLAVALAVTRELGIPDAAALGAMARAPEDPGALTVRTAAIGPDSLERILDGVRREGGCLFVFNHRTDRPLRLRQFAEGRVWKGPGVSVLITGDPPDWRTRTSVGLAIGPARVAFTPARLLGRALRETLGGDAHVETVVFCGNTRHLDVEAAIAASAGA
jgi:poly-gamma-glutamate synthase PgsB/CapB